MYYVLRTALPAIIVLIGVSALACQEGRSSADPVEPYTIVELVPGVYAAIANLGGSAGANAGIINMGQQVFIFDTGLTPKAGRQLRRKAEELTGNRVGFVVLSHFHDDHVGGSQAFDEATYLSTTPTQEAVKAAGEQRTKDDLDQAVADLDKVNAGLTIETDDRKRVDLEVMADYYLGVVDGADELRRVVPTVVWDRRLNFTGSDRRVKFMPTVTSHAPGDAMLWLEQDSVLFVGDLVTTDRHPVMRDGNPDGWLDVLDSILSLDFNVLVPGHGPVGDRQSVLNMKEYLLSVERAAADVLNGTDVKTIRVDSTFSDWMLEGRFAENIRFVADYRRSQ